MRNFKVMAAFGAALLIAGPVSAKEKTDPPKPRKICRSEHMPGRITPKRICREVPPSNPSAEARKTAGGRS